MGVPAMVALLAALAFVPKLDGWGILVALFAVGLLRLVIGAVVWMNKDER